MTVLPDSERAPLPALITTNGLMSELGVSRHEAERIMRAVPRRVQFVKGGRVYAYRVDVADLLHANETPA